jgi:hypothetical protein
MPKNIGQISGEPEKNLADICVWEQHFHRISDSVRDTSYNKVHLAPKLVRRILEHGKRA